MYSLKRRTLALAATAVAAVLAITGCASNGAEISNSGGGEQTPQAITIANEALITSLDPLECGVTECRRLYYLTNGYLTEFGTGELDLAESLTPNEDNTVWTATLRPDLVFSDGSALTSEDVVASFERYLQPPLEGTLEVFKTMSSVRATDERTVEIELTRPDADFVASIAYVPAAIFPSDQLAAPDFFENPVGAGQYVLNSHNLSTGDFALSANPEYWGEEPTVKEITFTTVPDGATRLAQVQSGQVDYAKSLPANLLANLSEDLRIEKVSFPGGLIHLVFNTFADSPSVTTDPLVREAIDLAVDREQIAEVALSGYMEPLYGMPWLDPKDRMKPSERNLEQAKELLAGTECADGCAMKFINITDFNWQLPLTSSIVQQNLAEIGIDVELVNTTFAAAPNIGLDQWDAIVFDPGSNVMTDASIANSNLANFYWWGAAPEYPSLVEMSEELAVSTAEEAPAVMADVDAAFAEELPWVALTDLQFLDVTSLPESVINSPIGWKLNVS